jgi:uncharacterized protein (DUF427 family)
VKAIWNGQVIAEADRADLIYLEGNWYFPKSAIKTDFFSPGEMRTVCPWRGETSYYDISVNGQVNKDAAWYYPHPKEGSIERVKKDFTDYVAFWRGVHVGE